MTIGWTAVGFALPPGHPADVLVFPYIPMETDGTPREDRPLTDRQREMFAAPGTPDTGLFAIGGEP